MNSLTGDIATPPVGGQPRRESVACFVGAAREISGSSSPILVPSRRGTVVQLGCLDDVGRDCPLSLNSCRVSPSCALSLSSGTVSSRASSTRHGQECPGPAVESGSAPSNVSKGDQRILAATPLTPCAVPTPAEEYSSANWSRIERRWHQQQERAPGEYPSSRCSWSSRAGRSLSALTQGPLSPLPPLMHSPRHSTLLLTNPTRYVTVRRGRSCRSDRRLARATRSLGRWKLVLTLRLLVWEPQSDLQDQARSEFRTRRQAQQRQGTVAPCELAPAPPSSSSSSR